ncbi:Protein phosphatase 1 regulatory subunit 12C [Eumeta japonica]|uniref:Protein phosphatase 1 regulatory subunit 12C n=1 Tax=Eumeta variegata TaxID=151549 RepID=A0A4C2A2E6_EUMVA|nr:Protein phosphatase 1 regulatory subunit 12C [Eumeta japonica]
MLSRSFVPPVRDEESETQRKAHAKRVRETRRSTQGVTLDEIKSAEQFVKKKAGNGVATVETAPAKKSNEEPSVPAVNKDANSTRGKWVSDVAVTLALAAATATATATIAPTAERRPTWRLRLETNKFELEDAARSPSPRPTNNSADTTVTLPLRRVVTNAVNNNTAATVVNNTGDDKGEYTVDFFSGTDDDKEREGSVDSKTGSNSSLSSTQAALNVIQRRRRPKRRSTGVGHVDIDFPQSIDVLWYNSCVKAAFFKFVPEHRPPTIH